MSTVPEGLPNAPEVAIDTLSYEYVGGLQQRFTDKMFNPLENQHATNNLIQLRESWAREGAITVFTSGVYDMLHLDHAGYLLHTKATGAAVHYSRSQHKKPWEELEPSQQQLYTSRILGQGLLRLVVSVDGDQSVAVRKAAKGGAARPVYAWPTRAIMVASQAYVNPLSRHQHDLLPTVDAVTIHGPDDFSRDSVHASHFALAEKLQPDVWAVFEESADVLEEAPQRAALGGIALRCIRDGHGTHYFEDAFMGKMSTTNTVKRILGTE